MKRIVVVCGNGVATSQSAAYKINRMLEKKHIVNASVEAVNLRSLETELRGAIAYVEISRNHHDDGIPKIGALAIFQEITRKQSLKSW